MGGVEGEGGGGGDVGQLLLGILHGVAEVVVGRGNVPVCVLYHVLAKTRRTCLLVIYCILTLWRFRLLS